jgi:hypothetical protein
VTGVQGSSYALCELLVCQVRCRHLVVVVLNTLRLRRDIARLEGTAIHVSGAPLVASVAFGTAVDGIAARKVLLLIRHE